MQILTQDGAWINALGGGEMLGCVRRGDGDVFEIFVRRGNLPNQGRQCIGAYPSGRCQKVVVELINAMKIRDWFVMPPVKGGM